METHKTTWTHLLERLSKPTVTGETVAEYKAMKKSDRDNRKDIGGFVCGYLKDGQRLKQNVEYRQVVCLDADSPDGDFLTDLDIGMGNVAWGLYTTHSHTAAAPRYRVLIPLDRPVTADEYKAITRLLAKTSASRRWTLRHMSRNVSCTGQVSRRTGSSSSDTTTHRFLVLMTF